MGEFRESYRRIGDATGRFDIEFWQAQGDQAIFHAALEMILDYLTLRDGHAAEPRLQRTVEHFGKLEAGLTQRHEDTKEHTKTESE